MNNIDIIMDQYIDVSKVAEILGKKQPGLSEALLGMHSLTGCDFTFASSARGR